MYLHFQIEGGSSSFNYLIAYFKPYYTKQWSSSQSLSYNVHMCAQFLQTNDLTF